MLNIYTIYRPGISLTNAHVCFLVSAQILIKLKPLHKAQSQRVKHNLMVPDVPSPVDIHKTLQKNGLQCYKPNLRS